jgi:multidrug efflux pump subunit AcrA (membrane-fusion protein)
MSGGASSGSGSGANGAGVDGAAQQGARGQFASPTSPVLPGQLRRVWVLGSDGKPQPRRIRVGLTDGASTEVVEGDLKEGDVIITGQTVNAASKSQNSNAQSAPPGFGGAPRFGGGGGAPRGGR